MSQNSINLALAFHNHQPVGNFDGTIEECFQKSYRPFLELISRPEYTSLKVSIHNSGCLAEWLDRHHPEYLDKLAELARQGRVEVLGGPFQEPILAMIPSRDRIGQILTHTHWLEKRLGVKIRGMWMPERVWEQSCVRDLTEAGMEFTILDDYHFKKAGIPEEKLYGYYLTEDDGRLMAVYPDSENLRYWIPFDSIDRSLNYLREIARTNKNAVLFCGDDGEKFGAWPQTYEHVYGSGNWLARFFDALVQNADWLKTVTMSEARDQVKPLGKCSLPDCSYREMTEWALSTPARKAYDSAVGAIPAKEEIADAEETFLKMRQTFSARADALRVKLNETQAETLSGETRSETSAEVWAQIPFETQSEIRAEIPSEKMVPECSHSETQNEGQDEWGTLSEVNRKGGTQSEGNLEDAAEKTLRKFCSELEKAQKTLLALRPFVSGGNWRNFRIKYPETNEMYCRMLAVSRRLEKLQNWCRREALNVSGPEFFQKFQYLEDARLELYRGQCNCPYWHGAFGGVYLPHLRNGIFKHLIAADNLLDKIAPNEEIRADFDLDGELEYRLETDDLSAWIAPESGGMLYELDVRKTGLNLLATLARRPEPYHEPMVKAIEARKRAEAARLAGAESAGGMNADGSDEDLGNIRDKSVFKQEGLERRLQYDDSLRKSLLDGFFAPDVTAEALYDGKARPDKTFYRMQYQAKYEGGKLTLAAVGPVRSFEGNVYQVSICKMIELRENVLDVTWRLGGLPRWETVLFGVEFNFAGLPGHCSDRYFYGQNGQYLGDLSSCLNTKAEPFLGLADEWQKLRVELEASRITDFWTCPVETVSNSEGGFELVHQSVCVIPHWFIRAENDGSWECRMKIRIKNEK